MITNVRDLKNAVVLCRPLIKAAVICLNLPVIGAVYDYFYFRRLRAKVDSAQLTTILIETNNTCNLKCVMCPYPLMTRAKATMGMELFKRIVDQAIALGCNDFSLQMYNEPFTDQLLFDRLAYLNAKERATVIYSNATLLTDAIIRRVLDTPPRTLRLSVDGYSKQTYEAIRIGANYESTVDGIVRLYQERNRRGLRYPRMELFFTVMERNRHEVAAFTRFWKNKCDYISFATADSRRAAAFSYYKAGRTKAYPCYCPTAAVVHSNGNVVMCTADANDEVVLGDLNRQPLKDILKSQQAMAIFESQMNGTCNIPLCRRCSRPHTECAFSWWHKGYY